VHYSPTWTQNLLTMNNTRAFPSHCTSTFELTEEMYVDQGKNGETIVTEDGTSLVLLIPYCG